ncbi:MAG: recombinase family protein [bacterium]
MKKTRRAIGYVCEIPIPGTDLAIGRELQKQRLKGYSQWERIDLAEVIEEDAYQKDLMARPGIRKLLNIASSVHAVLVERVWCLSRKRKDLDHFLRALDQKGAVLLASSCLWDSLSQYVRHRYMGTLAERAEKRRQGCRERQEKSGPGTLQKTARVVSIVGIGSRRKGARSL